MVGIKPVAFCDRDVSGVTTPLSVVRKEVGGLVGAGVAEGPRVPRSVVVGNGVKIVEVVDPLEG